MNCKSFSELIDEMFDGEPDASLENSAAEHIADCEACRRKLNIRRAEQSVYASFYRSVETPAGLSERFLERLANETSVDPVQPTASTGFLSLLFSSLRWQPMFAAVSILIGALAVVLTLGPRTGPHLAEEMITNAVIAAPSETRRLPDLAFREQRSAAIESREPLRDRRSAQSTPKTKTKGEIALSVETAELRDFEIEMSKQAERIELLLRSFRNSEPSDQTDSYDVSFEMNQARELLESNSKLRDRARAAGSVIAVEILERVEPYLLDIANLDQRPAASEVQEIKRRMRDQRVIVNIQGY